MIFNFTEGLSITARLGTAAYQLPRCFINGFATMPIELRLPGRQHFLGVRLQPLAIKRLFGAPASAFLDQLVDVTLLDPAFGSLWHELGALHDFTARVHAFGNWMEQKWIDWKPQEWSINQFLCTNQLDHPSVTKLAAAMCYSPRQLARKMVEATGMNTEDILLYKKYLQAVELMHHTHLPLTAIAYHCHFSDQSHFIRSFRQFAQMTPGEYRKNKSHQQGHLYKDVR